MYADIVARLTIRSLLSGRHTSTETRAAKLAMKAKDECSVRARPAPVFEAIEPDCRLGYPEA